MYDAFLAPSSRLGRSALPARIVLPEHGDVRSVWWSAVGVACMLAVPAGVSAAPPGEREVTIDPPTPVPGGEIIITLGGWPKACSSVELAYLDGSVGGRDQGDVLGSWGLLELVDGGGSTTVTAPGPEEYNLRVSGPSEICGEPYYSPDFFVSDPPVPDPLGWIRPMWLTDGGLIIGGPVGDEPPIPARVEVLAGGWTAACPSLDVVVVGESDSTNLGVIELDGGDGSISAPAAALTDVAPSDDLVGWDVVATGPVDECGGPYITELRVSDMWPLQGPSTITVAPDTTFPETASVSPAATASTPVDLALPTTGADEHTTMLIAIIVAFAGGALIVASRRRADGA